jgi:hypothetical protein
VVIDAESYAAKLAERKEKRSENGTPFRNWNAFRLPYQSTAENSPLSNAEMATIAP